MKRIVSTLILVILVLSSLVTASLAWFAKFFSAHSDGEFAGSSIAAYFADGDGSQGDPYIIENATHFYNLSWLQNQGAFDGKKYYFKVCDLQGNPITLDMAGKITGGDTKSGAIPPIGTKENPFVGYFDGCGSTISNLWVSTEKEDWKERPEDVSNDYSSTHVGLFGAIGNNAIIEDFVLDRVEVKSHINATVGIVCGYVDAMIYNVGVYNGIINLTSESVSQSKYTLVGEISGDITWADMPELDAAYGGGGGGSDDGGAGWGGSINMSDLTKRLVYMSVLNIEKNNSSWLYPSANENYNLNVWMGEQKPNAVNPKTHYLMSGTVLPLNVDTVTMFKTINSNYTNPNGITGLTTTEYYSSHSNELIESTNTGYIAVGTGTSTSNAAIRVRLYQFDGLYKSFNKTSGTTTATTLYSNQKNNLVLLGLDGNGNFVQLSDTYNKIIEDEKSNSFFTSYGKIDADSTYKNYTTVRAELDSIFLNSTYTTSSKTYTTISGIRFYTAINGTTVPAPSGAKIGGTAINDLVSNSINFKVNSPGLITAVAGAYFQNSNHSLFDIYQVERSGGSVDNIKKISKIYMDSSNLIYYVYEGDSDAYNGNINYTKKYDDSWTSSKIPSYTLSYYEIPVKEGEYAIGGTNGAYLMYLDIGANGDEGSSGGGTGDEIGEIVDGVYAPVMFDIDYVVSPSTDVSAVDYVNHKTLLKIEKNQTTDNIMLYFLAAGSVDSPTVAYYAPSGVTITDISKEKQSRPADSLTSPLPPGNVYFKERDDGS